MSTFANALRLRVLTTARVAYPTTRNISSLVVFRTAVPQNMSLSMSRLFTTSQVARYVSKINVSPSTTIYVRNIPWSATERELKRVFSEFGDIKAIKLHVNSEGRSRGQAHIEFVSLDSATSVVAGVREDAVIMSGRYLTVYFATGKWNRKVTTEPSEKLYFSDFAGEESEIRTIFKKYGDSIVGIRRLRNPKTGERKSAGFLKFKNTEIATEALEALNGTQTPDGSTLALSYARSRKNLSFDVSDRDLRQGFSTTQTVASLE